MAITGGSAVRTCTCTDCHAPALRDEMVCLPHWAQYRVNALMGETPLDREQREADRRERIRRMSGH
jgi:hypothetical protein